MIVLTRDPLTPDQYLTQVQKDHCGAVVLFLGTVRDLTGPIRTTALEYEAYVPMAEKQLQALEADIRARWPVGDVVLAHRLGRLVVGETSVAVAISAPHRADAFEAARYAIDTLKAIVPIWKKDEAPDGRTTWVEGPPL
jgi:molybdopterin synthase catalytic subunit